MLDRRKSSIIPTFPKTCSWAQKIALLPGDPGRVQSLAEAMGPAVELVSHREYTSYLAQVASQPILVISTGMGGPSTAICLEELARLGIKRVIRVGTTGSIKDSLDLAMLSLSRSCPS